MVRQQFPKGRWNSPWRYSETGEFKSRFRCASMCMVHTRKIIAPSIEIASGHTTRGFRTNEVVSPATEQNKSAPIAFLKPASLRNAGRPMAQAAKRAATATNPRIRGAIMLGFDRAGRKPSRKSLLPPEAAGQLARELSGWYFFASGCVLAGPQWREVSGTRGFCLGSQRSHRSRR